MDVCSEPPPLSFQVFNPKIIKNFNNTPQKNKSWTPAIFLSIPLSKKRKNSQTSNKVRLVASGLMYVLKVNKATNKKNTSYKRKRKFYERNIFPQKKQHKGPHVTESTQRAYITHIYIERARQENERSMWGKKKKVRKNIDLALESDTILCLWKGKKEKLCVR